MKNSSSISFPSSFLWGAATSAHQIEGNNVASDWWAMENSAHWAVKEPSGDAMDSWHRWPEDMALAARAGLKDYRFSIEWARIEPEEGRYSLAAIAHYRAMVEGAISAGLRPMVTLHHFTLPQWLARQGGWLAPNAIDRFLAYVRVAGPIIANGVEYVCTINEPNIVALFGRLAKEGPSIISKGMPEPDFEMSNVLIEAHQRVREMLRYDHPNLKTGWSVAAQCFQALPGAEEAAAAYARSRETVFFEAAREDDWVGVQSYTRTVLDQKDGVAVTVRPEKGTSRTLTGWEYYPLALGGAVRDAHRITNGTPIIVTENGIATADDAQRIAYTTGALTALRAAMDDGIEVRGYYHWSLLDNYEWGKFEPTFGLIAVDRETFVRTPKPSLAWLGNIAATDGLTVRQTEAA